MKIGGWQKVSLSDYPGKLCAVVFTSGCAFRCGFCHNPALVRPSAAPPVDEAEILEYLRRRRPLLEAVVVTGGEPTLHRDLPEFIAAVKALGYLVKLDTAGCEPEALGGLLASGRIDYVAMDVKAPEAKYSAVAGVPVDARRVRDSISRIIRSGIDHEFRTTLVEGLHDAEDILEIARMISGAQAYYLQRFRSGAGIGHVDPAFSSRRAPPDSVLSEAASRCLRHVAKCETR